MKSETLTGAKIKPATSPKRTAEVKANTRWERDAEKLRKLIWIYFLMFLFEGVPRKWIVPSLAGPLLFMRDPIVLAVIWYGFRAQILKGPLVTAGTILSILCVLAGWATLPDYPLVALAGLRATLLHFPVIAVGGAVLRREDVVKIARFTLILSIPMAILMAAQFAAGSSSPLNAGAGEGARQIGGMYGDKVRASGTFSFVNGTIAYYSLVASCVAASLMGSLRVSKPLTIAAGCSCIVALSASGSRTFLASLLLVVVTAVFVVPLLQPRFAGVGVKSAIAFALMLAIAVQFPAFRDGWSATGKRVSDTGGGKEGGVENELNDRIFYDYTRPFEVASITPALGGGFGTGTNVGTTLMYGQPTSLYGRDNEREWSRHVLESGPILGFGMILIRISVVLSLLRLCVRRTRQGDVLPMVLFSGCGLALLTTNLGQPSNLGGAVIVGAFTLAAIRHPEEERVAPNSAPLRRGVTRRRSLSQFST